MAAIAAPAIGTATAIAFAAAAIPTSNKVACPASLFTNSVNTTKSFVKTFVPSITAGLSKSPTALDKFSVSFDKSLNT